MAALAAIGGAAGLAIWRFAAENVSHAPNVLVNVQTDPRLWNRPIANWGQFTYVVPRTLAEIGKPPLGPSWNWQSWAQKMGGVSNRTQVQLTVEAENRGQVLVQGVWPEILEQQRPPPNGTAISSPSGGATPEARLVYVDLDSGETDYWHPAWEPTSKGGYEASRSEAPYAFALNRGEVGVILVDATARRLDVRWQLRVDLIVSGKTQTRTYGPFRTMSDQNRPHYLWTGRWEAAGLSTAS